MMDQVTIVGKLERFLQKEFGAVATITITPGIVTKFGTGNQKAVEYDVVLGFKVR